MVHPYISCMTSSVLPQRPKIPAGVNPVVSDTSWHFVLTPVAPRCTARLVVLSAEEAPPSAGPARSPGDGAERDASSHGGNDHRRSTHCTDSSTRRPSAGGRAVMQDRCYLTN